VNWLQNVFLLASASGQVNPIPLLRDQQATVEKIEAFAKKAAADVKPGGTLWFVFIGHGAPIGSSLVLFDAGAG
jgi:hypothetical protein